jgi:hypothetical protein
VFSFYIPSLSKNRMKILQYAKQEDWTYNCDVRWAEGDVISVLRFPLLLRKFVPETITNKALHSTSPETSHLVVIIVTVEHDIRCLKVTVKVGGAKFFSSRFFFCHIRLTSHHKRCDVSLTTIERKRWEKCWHRYVSPAKHSSDDQYTLLLCADDRHVFPPLAEANLTWLLAGLTLI